MIGLTLSISQETWSNLFTGLMVVIVPLLGKKGISVIREVTENMTNRIVNRLDGIDRRLDNQDDRIDEIASSVNEQVLPVLIDTNKAVTE